MIKRSCWECGKEVAAGAHTAIGVPDSIFCGWKCAWMWVWLKGPNRVRLPFDGGK